MSLMLFLRNLYLYVYILYLFVIIVTLPLRIFNALVAEFGVGKERKVKIELATYTLVYI